MIQRKFIPGSQWLYFKIYTGVKTADEVLAHTIRPFLRELYAERWIDGSFFIRYNDPDFHIRLRLHIDRFENYAPIFRRFEASFQPLVENGAVIRVLCDTYVREIERYGADTMEPVERLFGIDSGAILKLLEKIEELPTDTRETTRWQLALTLLDDTMTAFGKTPDEKKHCFPGWPRISRRSSDSPRIRSRNRSMISTAVTERTSKSVVRPRDVYGLRSHITTSQVGNRESRCGNFPNPILRPGGTYDRRVAGQHFAHDDEPLVPYQ